MAIYPYAFPTIDPEKTGKNIARLRKEAGYSVRDLQDFFGFEAPQAIYKWQRGESMPSVDNFLALSELFRLTINEIVVYRDNKNDELRFSRDMKEYCRCGNTLPLFLGPLNYEFNDKTQCA